MLQLDEINQLFLPYMRNKLLWFYQEVEDAEPSSTAETVSVWKNGCCF
jgi:dynein heavy chain